MKKKSNNSKNIHKGGAMRTRDEFLKGGVPKEEYKDKPKQYYRVVYAVDINSDNDLAIVRRTTKKGRRLKSQPQHKFHEEIYTQDNKGAPIRLKDKFVRSSADDIAKEDVGYIVKRCRQYPDTARKMQEFKNRPKKKPPKK